MSANSYRSGFAMCCHDSHAEEAFSFMLKSFTMTVGRYSGSFFAFSTF